MSPLEALAYTLASTVASFALGKWLWEELRG